MAESELITVDEDFIKKVDAILDGDTDKVQIKVQIGLVLALQSQMAKATNALVSHVKEQTGRMSAIERQVADLQKKNIVAWAINKPKAAITVIIVFVILVDVLVDRFSSIDALLVIILAFRKWLGI